MGSLAKQFLDAMAGNPALADAFGASGESPEKGLLSMTQLYLAIIGSGYVIQAVGLLRTEESAGRLEPRLAGRLSRRAWLAAHTWAVLGGLAIVSVVGSAVLAAALAASTGHTGVVGSILAAGAAYLPAELVLAGLALALFGLFPRLFPLAWAVYALTTFIAFLAPGLKFPGWVRDLAPTSHVGNPPLGSPQGPALATLGIAAVILVAVAVAGFRRREIPQG
jgi:ABC-2 type transport system permease protein